MSDVVAEVGHRVARVAERMGLMTEAEFMAAFEAGRTERSSSMRDPDPLPVDTSPEPEPEPEPRDDDASDTTEETPQ